MSRHTISSTAITLACVLFLCGCGNTKRVTATQTTASTLNSASKTSESPPVSKPLSRAELIQKADVICARLYKQTSDNPLSANVQFAPVAAKLAAFEKTASAELEALTPPAELAGDWSAIVSASNTMALKVDEVSRFSGADALRRAVQALTSVGPVQDRMVRIAKRDGFKACARA